MRGNIKSIMIASMMMAGMGDMMERRIPEKKKRDKFPTTPQTTLQLLIKSIEGVEKDISTYCEKRQKGQRFEVQGFFITAINKKNATKAIRSILGKNNLNIDLSKKKLSLAILEIERRIDNQ